MSLPEDLGAGAARPGWFSRRNAGRWAGARGLGGALLPLAIVLVVMGAALAADWIAPHSPVLSSIVRRLRPPVWLEGGSWDYLLGTDELGRDILSRLIYGARISLTVALSAVIGAGGIGVALGLVAGYCGGKLAAVIMRLTDAAQSIPLILVALLFVVTLGQSFGNIIIALVVLLWSR